MKEKLESIKANALAKIESAGDLDGAVRDAGCPGTGRIQGDVCAVDDGISHTDVPEDVIERDRSPGPVLLVRDDMHLALFRAEAEGLGVGVKADFAQILELFIFKSEESGHMDSHGPAGLVCVGTVESG